MYIRTCVVCGVQFHANHGAQRLCSPECRAKRNHAHLIEGMKRFHARGNRPLRKKCIVCQQPFMAGRGYARNRGAKCCSVACRLEHARQRVLDYQARIHATVTRRCVVCGLAFYAVDRTRQITCSNACARHIASDAHWRRRQRLIASGKMAEYEARRRASGYFNRYKRKWRQRRAQAQAELEMLLIGTVLGA